MTIELLSISWRRCRVLWSATLAAAALAALGGGWSWRQANAATQIRLERFAREAELRRDALAAAERDRRRDAERALVERLLAAPLSPSAIETLSDLRKDLTAAGIADAVLEADAPVPAGAISLVTVRLQAPASYSAFRRFLARSESRALPIGWERLSNDGRTLHARVQLLARSDS